MLCHCTLSSRSICAAILNKCMYIRKPAVAGMADSMRQVNLFDCHFRDLEMTPSRSTEVKGQGALLLNGQWWTYLYIDNPGLGATVLMIQAIFTFVTRKNPLIKVNRGQRSLRIWNLRGQVSLHRNHDSIYHRLVTMHDHHRQTDDRQTTPLQQYRLIG